MTSHIYTIYTDGGSRGNPGPAASGYTIAGPDIEPIEHGDYLGIATNNVAEYTAAINALKRLGQMLGSEKAKSSQVEIYADSELMVKQAKGEYKVKNADLRILFRELYNLSQQFKSVTFIHVRREKNTHADRMVNEVLDSQKENLGE